MFTVQGQSSRILTAYTDLIAELGVRGATMQSIAQRAGLSKSGVLHHFPSALALRTAIFAEARAQVDADVDLMREAPEGAVRYYLRTSIERTTELERVIEACVRIAQTGNQDALQVLRESRSKWLDVLIEATNDPLLARTILMAGDGVNHNALLQVPDDETFLTHESVEALITTFENLAKISSR